MPLPYSDNLRLEMIADGEQAGTWGQTTIRNLGTLLEEAISGVASIVLAGASDLTLTALDGAADQSRKMVLSFTGGNSQARDIICPAVNKVYIVNNQSNDTLTLKKTAGTVNVTIPAGGSSTVYSVAGDFYTVGVSGSFSNLGGVVTASAAELNVLDGITASTTELNLLDGVTATTPELNILDGVTATAAELNILDGVTATAADLNKTATLPTLASGTWTSTLTIGSNITSLSFTEGTYLQVGAIVHAAMRLSITPTTGGSAANLRFTLPIAATFVDYVGLVGNGYFISAPTTVSNQGGRAYVDINDLPSYSFIAPVSGQLGVHYITFQYRTV